MREYNFFKPEDNHWVDRQTNVKHYTSTRLNIDLRVRDMIPGQLLHDFPVNNAHYYYMVVCLSGETEVFVIKTRLKVGEKFRSLQVSEIAARNTLEIGVILRPVPRKFKKPKMRPMVRYPQRCYAMAR
jgi:hypothetical protein